jgi:hypothetical protein
MEFVKHATDIFMICMASLSVYLLGSTWWNYRKEMQRNERLFNEFLRHLNEMENLQRLQKDSGGKILPWAGQKEKPNTSTTPKEPA